ncbi:MAG: TrkH family potassium uptake protein [Dehalococcoidales bacterium]|nr:TrkH family potassium uptake protein [Dehalococcoidales bacterium]
MMRKDKREPKLTSRSAFVKSGDKVFRVPRPISWQVLPRIINRPRSRGISTSILIWGFIGIIILGALLLMFPIATESGKMTHPIDALFTATSASCVTGLSVVDTADHWSYFGEGIILVLAQFGGWGFMTLATLFLLALGRKIGLRERILIRESMGVARLGGVVRIARQIAVFTIIVETIGAGLIYISLSTRYTTGIAIWKSVFQSVSAFNNCGFDLFGGFRSMTDYHGDPLLILTTAGLIIMGGISYLVIADIARARNFTRLSLDSKMVITTTLCLLGVGTIVILLTEMNNPATLGPLSLPQKILNAFFHAVTPRTAGFATLNIGDFAVYSLFFTIFLMFIGGASGSTAGGIKVNTFGLLIATILSTIKGKEKAGAFGREFTTQQIYRALTLVILSMTLMGVIVFALSITEKFTFLQLFFETVSAFGTVGLSTGITPGLSITGKILITLMMFIGRVGPLALVLSLAQRQQVTEFNYPQETLRIG